MHAIDSHPVARPLAQTPTDFAAVKAKQRATWTDRAKHVSRGRNCQTLRQTYNHEGNLS
jgi:hypothetical protein